MEHKKFKGIDEELLENKDCKIVSGTYFDKRLTIYCDEERGSGKFITQFWIEINHEGGYSQFCHGYGHNINQALRQTDKLEYHDEDNYYPKKEKINLTSLERLMISNKNFGITAKRNRGEIRTSLIGYLPETAYEKRKDILSLNMPTFSEAFAILNSINFTEKMFKKILQKYVTDKALEEFNKDNKRDYLRT